MIEILNGIHETIHYQNETGIRLYQNVEPENYPLHWHTAIEIIMPLENIYTVEVNESRYILQPEDIFVISSGELHKLFAPDWGSRIILQLDTSLLYTLNGFHSVLPLLSPFKLITSETAKEIHGTLHSLLLHMMSEYFSDDPLKEASIYASVIQFFVAFGRFFLADNNKFTNTTVSKQHEYIEKFLTVCSYINSHCTESITIDELSKIAGFSKFHFVRLFKQFTNMTCYEYLSKHRILYAEKLLADPKLTITEVAMQSGFNSISTFNRTFKNIKKCTPTEYKYLYGSESEKRDSSSDFSQIKL